MITKNELENLKKIQLKNCDCAMLADLAIIEINENLSVSNRLKEFFEKIKNPYVFKVDNTKVKVSFSENETSLKEKLINLINLNLSK